jgi:hypothetical protein
VSLQTTWHPIAAGDVNGDGNQDIVVTDLGSGDVVVLLGNGDGSFQPPIHSSVPAFANGNDSTGPVDFILARLGATDAPSLVIADDNSASLLIESFQSDGTLAQVANLPIMGGGWSYPFVADLNCDTLPDLVNADAYGRVSAFLALPDGGYASAGAVALPGERNCVADFNDDGFPDVVVEQPMDQPALVVFPGAGDGTFPDGGIVTSLGIGGQDIWISGDLNEDGHLDLLLYNGGGMHEVLLGRGDGTFEIGSSPQTLSDGYLEVLQDLNGDGHLDLVDDAATGVNVALGNGDGTFQTETQVLQGMSVWMVIAADLNNDGRPDLIVADWDDTNIQILLNNCR